MSSGRERGEFTWPPGWVPGPLHEAPRSVHPPYREYRAPWEFDTEQDRADALGDALAGVELGDYDREIVAWLAGRDNATVATIVSLVHRARLAPRSGEVMRDVPTR